MNFNNHGQGRPSIRVGAFVFFCGEKMRKYIFVTGGVVSGLGKGIVAASLGLLLKSRGYKVASQKLDPYMNVDPGTMSPYQHGEVFVTEDGTETDLDLGHYERFIDENLNYLSNLTSGKIYSKVIEKERRGDYLGKTVQIIPHVTGEIVESIFALGKLTDSDIVITEIGGTIGDIESQPFLEAAREVRNKVGAENSLFIHVVLVPYLKCSGEHKTKPAQHSVRELQGLGIMPDIVIARSDETLEKSVLDKLSLFCNTTEGGVIALETLGSLYEVPLVLHKRGFDSFAISKLALEDRPADLGKWIEMVDSLHKATKKVKIAIVGKYTELHDAYLSIIEALHHAACKLSLNVDIKWVESEDVEKYGASKYLSDVSGVLIPGGFGDRGIEGMIKASEYARVNNIPFFGICLGMQIAVIEAARDLAGLENANSTEFNINTPYPVISLLSEQQNVKQKGASMRLGAYDCTIEEGTLLERIYSSRHVSERHRHRYEVNPKYVNALEKCGIVFSGRSPDGSLVEAMENPNVDYFVAVQSHPEFKSRPVKPHPLFVSFLSYAEKKEK